MEIEIREQSVESLARYVDITIAFEVSRILEITVQQGGFGGFALAEVPVGTPYIKEYDGLECPADWALRFDLSNWGFFGAWLDGRRVAGAVVARKTPAVFLLEGRDDLAVLWDIRVAPEARRLGVGSSLFRAVAAWAAAHGCVHLKVETQNINVPACRFYARQGCELGAINRFAYPALPEEVQLLWYKGLGGRHEITG